MSLNRILLVAMVVFACMALAVPASAVAGTPVIVLDPGHSGSSLTTIDPETQIRDEEYANTPELTNMFDVAIRLKAKLEAVGYTVLLTKQNATDTVCKRARTDIANNADAALAVSIHTSGSQFGHYGEIYVQTLDSYRENVFGQRVYFSDASVAALSAQYGQVFLAERRKIEGSSVVVSVNTSWGGRGLAPGNIPIVQLFSKVPWILTEAGVPSGAAERDLYAQSLFNSIVACVPIDGTPATPAIPTSRFQQTDDRIMKKGTWETLAKTAASEGSYGRSSSSDASALITFIGTRLDVVGVRGTTTGIVDVYLDGTLRTTIDLASSVATYQVPLWSTEEVPIGQHTVELVRNSSSAAGKYITLDAVDVTGTLTYPRPVINSIDPSGGVATGGTPVLITGTGFSGVTGVTFGGIPATITSVDSANQQITVVAPPAAMGEAQVQVTAGGGKSADTRKADFAYGKAPPFTRYEQGDARIVKTGAWSDYSEARASGGSYGRSSTAGASATIYFTGSRIDWVAMRGVTTGLADVYVDGVKVTITPINLAASVATYQVKVWSSGDLPYGAHNVRIVRSSSSATGKFLTLDAVEIWGAIDSPPPTKTRYEQTNTHIVKAGAWSDFTVSKASGGSYGRSSELATSASISFVGTRLDWIATQGTTPGLADVYLDGVKMTPSPVSLISSVTKYQVNVWSTGTLLLGPHTVLIVRSASSGTGQYLTLDALDIWGTIAS